MASFQIIKNEIESRILKNIESNFQKIITKFRTQINKKFNNAQELNKKYIDYVNNKLSTLNMLFNNFITSANPNDKLEILASIRKLVDILTQIKNAKTNFYIEFEGIVDDAKFYCNEYKDESSFLYENIPNEAMEIYESILNSERIVIKRPIIGEVIITVTDIESLLEKQSLDLYNFINGLLQNFDLTIFNVRSDQFEQECNNTLEDIINMEKYINENEASIINNIYPLINSIIDIIQRSNLRVNDDLKKFVNLLNDVLHIYVEIELQEPETSKDILYASFLDICEINPQFQQDKKNKLINIGLDIGFDIKELEHLSDTELCNKIGLYFNY